MLEIARYTRRPAFFFVLQTLSKLFWSCCVVYPTCCSPGVRCMRLTTYQVLSKAVVDRVRLVRLENCRQKQINGVRFNMSENVLERGAEYSDHDNVMMQRALFLTEVHPSYYRSRRLSTVDSHRLPGYSTIIRRAKSNLPLLPIWKKDEEMSLA